MSYQAGGCHHRAHHQTSHKQSAGKINLKITSLYAKIRQTLLCRNQSQEILWWHPGGRSLWALQQVWKVLSFLGARRIVRLFCRRLRRSVRDDILLTRRLGELWSFPLGAFVHPKKVTNADTNGDQAEEKFRNALAELEKVVDQSYIHTWVTSLSALFALIFSMQVDELYFTNRPVGYLPLWHPCIRCGMKIAVLYTRA